MFRFPYRALRSFAGLAVAVLLSLPGLAEEPLELLMRSRAEENGTPVYAEARWKPSKTAVIVCDMWNTLRCEIVADRVAELAPRMNQVLKAARARGITIVHAPSGTMDFYADTPQRKRCLAAPKVDTPVPLHWNPLDADREPPLPIDDEHGWEGPVQEGPAPQTRQHPAIKIAPEDAIGDGPEVYYYLEARGIENVVLMGVHTNKCVLGRPFGIRQMVCLGKRVALMRDMTDSLYNPKYRPQVSHWRGTELVVEHIERYWCPTFISTELTGEPAFRFQDDPRPHVVFAVSDDHYDADKTLPVFAQRLREQYETHCTVLHGLHEHEIPNVAELRTADALVVFVRRLGLPEEQLAAIQAYAGSGNGLVGLRTANHAFKMHYKDPKGWQTPEGRAEWPEFDAQVLGGNYHNHAPNELGTDVRVLPEAAAHPVVANLPVREWHSIGSLYYTSPVAEDAAVLMTGSIPDRTEPLTWVREYNGGRVLYSGLGHPEDFDDPQFLRLLTNAIYWTMRKTPPVE